MNTKKLKKLLHKVLQIIGYQKEEEKFIQKFLANINLQVFITLGKNLTKKENKKIEKIFTKHKDNPEFIKKKLISFFSKENTQKIYKKAAEKEMQNLINSIKDHLTQEQKQKLANLSSEFIPKK